jgi:hypothetical protein
MSMKKMTMLKTQQEIIGQGYQALVESLGVVNAIKFLQHFSVGQGNYTLDRNQWLNEISLEDVFQDMENLSSVSSFSNQQYEEIVE